MAAKRNAIQRTLRKAQSVLSSYIKPGRRSAEKSIDELVRVLHDTRITLMRTAKRTMRAKKTKRTSKRIGAAKRRTSAKAGVRRSAAAARRTAARKSGKRARR